MGDLVKASVNRYVLKRLVIEPSPIGGLKLTIARIPRKLRDAGVVDHFYAADPAPPPLPADGDPDKPRYAYACEDPDHPDYAGPWRGSDVVEPDPSAPPTPDLRTTYDHTTPTPDPSRPATAASEASRPPTAPPPNLPTVAEPPGGDAAPPAEPDVLEVHGDAASPGAPPADPSPRNASPP